MLMLVELEFSLVILLDEMTVASHNQQVYTKFKVQGSIHNICIHMHNKKYNHEE